ASTDDPASSRAAAALAALLGVPDDRAAAAAALADVAARHGAIMAPLAPVMLAHRDDADAAVRAAVLRFGGATGVASEASWVAERLARREAAEADAAMRALERLGGAAIDVTYATLCRGSLSARLRALAVVRAVPGDLTHWWPSVRREIDHG